MKKLNGIVSVLAINIICIADAVSLPDLFTGLDPNDWRAVCAHKSTMCSHETTINQGCTPNCEDEHLKNACKKILRITGVEDYVGVKVTDKAGMFVIRLSPNPTSSSISGPTINAGCNNVTCALFTPNGDLISPSITETITIPPGGIMGVDEVTIGPFNTAPIAVPSNTSSNYSTSMYQTLGFSANLTYYMICLSYTASTSNPQVLVNASTDGLSVSW